MEYNVLGVIFEVTKKRYYFEAAEGVEYKRGDKVIVDTARGQEFGVVYMSPRKMDEKQLTLPLKPVIRKATQEDIERFEGLRREAEEAMLECKKRYLNTNCL